MPFHMRFILNPVETDGAISRVIYSKSCSDRWYHLPIADQSELHVKKIRHWEELEVDGSIILKINLK